MSIKIFYDGLFRLWRAECELQVSSPKEQTGMGVLTKLDKIFREEYNKRIENLRNQNRKKSLLHSATKEYIHNRARTKDNFIVCYLNATRLGIDEIELVEQRSEDGLEVKWFCRPLRNNINNEESLQGRECPE